MNPSGVHEYLQIIWPQPHKQNMFDKEVTKQLGHFAGWGRMRRRLQDMSGLMVYGFEAHKDKAANDIQNDLIFLTAIAAYREVIG